jgi:hypothetical protein
MAAGRQAGSDAEDVVMQVEGISADVHTAYAV